MSILGIAAKWLFILCLPVLLLTASIGWAANSLWLYKYGFQANNVRQDLAEKGLGLSETDLEKVATGLISYFNSDDEFISLTVLKDGEPFVLFNQREVAHLRDFKGLIRLDYRVLLGTGIYALGYAGISLFWRRREYWRRLAWGVVGGGGITLGLMLFLGLWAILDFDGFFLQLHLISFANDLWLLDPTKDYLIVLFPRGFWYDATIFCTLATAAGTIVLGGAAWIYLKKSKST